MPSTTLWATLLDLYKKARIRRGQRRRYFRKLRGAKRKYKRVYKKRYRRRYR